jgi:hypothetical protein
MTSYRWYLLLAVISIQQIRCDGSTIPLTYVSSEEHLDSFSVTGNRAMQSKKSKSSKSLKKGPKFSKSTKGKGGKGYYAPTISPSPSEAPTCLECDDLAFPKINYLFNFGGRNGRTDTVVRVVFGGSLLLLLGCFCLLVLLHRSTHQKELGKGNSVNAAECFRGGLDEDTVVEDDCTVENALSWPPEC